MKTFNIVVLISGNGSNLQAIIDAIQTKEIHAKIGMVISDKPDAYGLTRATEAKIPTHVITRQDYPERAKYDEALGTVLEQQAPDLIVLAGFMRILGDTIVDQFYGRLINIHPSLLPKHRGLHTHQRVLDAGDSEHGATVHFVANELDAGPIIAQLSCQVDKNDTADSLQKRVQVLEHQLYPQVVKWFVDKRIKLVNNSVQLDNQAV